MNSKPWKVKLRMYESTRIRNLKKRLIIELPFYPNNKDTLRVLESQSLNNVLIHYLHWKTRLIPTRKRSIQIAPEVTADKRWKYLRHNINSLLEKIQNGIDVLPYLSEKAHKYGYTPILQIKNGDIDSWSDKDQILNTKGFHHFHLNMKIKPSGISERTNDVLFAQVNRTIFRAIGIFDHSVFDTIDEDGNMNTERSRMWKLHEKQVTFGMEPDAIYMSNPITASGHPVYLVQMADYYAKLIYECDPKLDDRKFINGLYDQGKMKHPNKYNFEWRINNLDLCIHDKKNEVLFNLHLGHI